MRMRTRLLGPGALLVLPSWKGCRRDKRTPRLTVPVCVQVRSCSLESRGALLPRWTATKRDGTTCALRYSFQPQPTASVQQYSRDAIAARNQELASARIDRA